MLFRSVVPAALVLAVLGAPVARAEPDRIAQIREIFEDSQITGTGCPIGDDYALDDQFYTWLARKRGLIAEGQIWQNLVSPNRALYREVTAFNPERIKQAFRDKRCAEIHAKYLALVKREGAR